jgi:hypothetical protein
MVSEEAHTTTAYETITAIAQGICRHMAMPGESPTEQYRKEKAISSLPITVET